MNKISLIFMLGLVTAFANAQSVAINKAGNAGNPAAALDLSDASNNTLGVLLTKVSLTTVASASPVTSPPDGLIVYNTNASVTGGSGIGFYYWSSTGNQWYYINNSGSSHGCQTYTCNGIISTFTIPAGVSSITVTTVGGGGGSGGPYNPGGYGALITGTLTVTPGEVLDIMVGGTGGASMDAGGGGGGGTFIWNNASTSQPLIVAGGGGGAASFNQGVYEPGANAQTSNGSAAALEAVNPSTFDGTDGTGGNAGAPGDDGGNGGAGCGGAGWLSSDTGISSGYYSPVGGGITPLSGGAGGLGYNSQSSYVFAGNGGHGGGGGGGQYSGGGGGGYNGGGGGWGMFVGGSGGGGGGSYFNGSTATSTSLATDVNGLGSVTITW